MSEAILGYEVSIEFDTAMKKLTHFEKRLGRFHKAQKKHITDLSVMWRNAFKGASMPSGGNPPVPPTPPTPPSGGGSSSSNRRGGYNNVNQRKNIRAQVMAMEELIDADKRRALLEQARKARTRKQLVQAREAVKQEIVLARAKRKTNEWIEAQGKHLSAARIQQLKNKLAASATLEEHRKITAEIKEQVKASSSVMNRFKSLSKSLKGNAAFNVASAAAKGMGLLAISSTAIGQQFESAEATMKMGLGDQQHLLKEHMNWVEQESLRLGAPLIESTKTFAKLLATNQGLSHDQLKEIFLGMAESNTVLGLSAAQGSRAMNAVIQMMSKGKVTAEELKSQLGEVVPHAFKTMVSAAAETETIAHHFENLSTDKYAAKFLELQQQGKIISEEVMPKFAQKMREAAQAGGALEDKLDSNRVQMNRMVAAWQLANKQMFEGFDDDGIGDGTKELFKSLANFLKENENAFRSLGKMIGDFTRGLAKAVDFLGKYFAPMIGFLTSVWDLIKMLIGGMSDLANSLFKVFTGDTFFDTMRNNLINTLTVVEEFINMFTGGKIGFWNTTGESIVEKLSKPLSELMEMFDGIGFAPSAAVGVAGLGSVGINPPQAISVKVEGDIVMDGEVVGKQVLRSEAAQQELDSRQTLYNY